MMKIRSTLLPCCLLLVLVSGCTAAGKRRQAGVTPTQAPGVLSTPVAPPGMRLGNPYYSALGENCYEVLSESGPPSRARAICQRQEGWVLLPQIHISLAPVSPATPRQP